VINLPMSKIKLKVSWKTLLNGFLLSFGIPFLLVIIVLAYVGGYSKGVDDVKKTLTSVAEEIIEPTPSAPYKPQTTKVPTQAGQTVSWGGPDLWTAVNSRRVEFGVSSLSTKSELCTIASIRLNELLELGTLDGHEGFSNMPQRRPDLKWIYEKYNLSEFLVAGAKSAQGAVDLWENTLGHKKLLTGGEYVWGCIYAQEGFGVAITAY